MGIPTKLGTTKRGNSDISLGLRNEVKNRVRVRVRNYRIRDSVRD